MLFPSRINKEEFQQMPVASFSGNIVVANDEQQADAAVAAIRASNELVGFDTETRPAFVKGQSYRVALIQLSAGQTAYIFRLHPMQGVCPSLKALLEDPTVRKIGLSTHDDFRNLRKWGQELAPQGFVELQQLVRQFGIEELSLSKIHAILFGLKISKRQQLSNWESPNLTDKQLQYAAFDAVACVRIYEKLIG